VLWKQQHLLCKNLRRRERHEEKQSAMASNEIIAQKAAGEIANDRQPAAVRQRQQAAARKTLAWRNLAWRRNARAAAIATISRMAINGVKARRGHHVIANGSGDAIRQASANKQRASAMT